MHINLMICDIVLHRKHMAQPLLAHRGTGQNSLVKSQVVCFASDMKTTWSLCNSLDLP